MSEATSLFSRILELSEDRLGIAVAELISSDRFVAAIERGLESGASARANIEKGVARLMQLFNVPTLDDLAELEIKLEDLESLLADTAGEMQRIEALLPKRPRNRKRGAAHSTLEPKDRSS